MPSISPDRQKNSDADLEAEKQPVLIEAVALLDSADYEGALVLLEQITQVESSNAEAFYKKGNALHFLGRIKEAIEAYKSALELRKDHPETYNDLGVAYQQIDQLEDSRAALEHAIEISPGFVNAYLNLGTTYGRCQMPGEAIEILQKAIAIKPDYAQLYYNLGNAYRSRGLISAAIEQFELALHYAPTLVDAINNIGLTRMDQGRLSEAEARFRDAMSVDPKYVKAINNLGLVLQKLNRGDEAINCFKKVLEIDPQYCEAYNNLGLVLNERSEFRESVTVLEKCLEVRPDYLEALINLSFALKQLGFLDESIDVQRRLISFKVEGLPDDSRQFVTRLGEHLLDLQRIPILYKEQSEIFLCREEFTRSIDQALAMVKGRGFVSDGERVILRSILFTMSNFYLAYQQMDDRELQEKYANLSTLILAGELEPFLKPIAGRKNRKKIRLGVASEFLKAHNGSFWTYDWLANLPSEDYDFFLYSLNGTEDDFTKKFAALGEYKWLPFGEQSYLSSLRIIKADELDVLILPDIGMGIATKIVSLVRVAPIQCTGWGHPVTSGSKHVDYYLSSDLMEAENADSHYTEELVRLPNLGLSLDLPYLLPPSSESLDFFEKPSRRTVYGSLQSLFKYLPQYDWIYAAIAKKVPDSLFLFVGTRDDKLTQEFEDRIRQTFQEADLPFDYHVRMLPRMTLGKFNMLLDEIDVNLDSLGWSGGVTTARVLLKDCPIVTMPEPFMRGRHSYAMLKMIGVEELIAYSLDDYVELAAKLADSEYREMIVEKIKKSNEILLHDLDCVRFLDSFLKERVASLKDVATVAESQSVPVQEVGRVTIAGLHPPMLEPVSAEIARPFFSVVIPVHDRLNFLERCVNSVLENDPGSDVLEVIVQFDVCDDAEIDPRKFVEERWSGRVKLNCTERRLGVYGNIDEGLKAATGVWLHVLQDDDFVLPGFYDLIRSASESAPEDTGVIVCGSSDYFEADGSLRASQALRGDAGVVENLMEKLLSKGNPVCRPAVVVRRAVFEKIGMFWNDMEYAADWEFWVRSALHFQWWYQPGDMARFSRHDDSLTAMLYSSGVSYREIRLAIDRIAQYLPSGRPQLLLDSGKRHIANMFLTAAIKASKFGYTDRALEVLRDGLHLNPELFDCSEFLEFFSSDGARNLRSALARIVAAS